MVALRWDFFISHASEDKDDVARPLAAELDFRGYSVWLDEAELTVGDTLHRSLDEGLANCHFGVVVLSPKFFSKKWPQYELDGLITRQTSGSRKVILPVWHRITEKEIARYSPTLASYMGVSTDDGAAAVADAMCRAADRAGVLPKPAARDDSTADSSVLPGGSGSASGATDQDAKQAGDLRTGATSGAFDDDPLTYQPDDSYPLFVWAGQHCLDHTLRRVVLRDVEADPRINSFFDAQTWRRVVRSQQWDGAIYYLTSFRYADGDDSKTVELGVTPTRYRQAITTQQLFHEDMNAAKRAHRILASEGAAAFVPCSPPNNIYVNVTIIDSEGCLFALQRSTITHDTGNVWTLGPCETMRDEEDEAGRSPQPRAMQLDVLVAKALRKEVGLQPSDFGSISISWLGYDFWMPTANLGMARENYPGANVRVHAQVRSRLSCKEMWKRMSLSAPDRFEHQSYAAIRFDEEHVRSIIRAAVASQPDGDGRLWVRFSALAASEAFRCGSLI